MMSLTRARRRVASLAVPCFIMQSECVWYLLIPLLWLVLTATMARATTYYVAPDGRDSNDGMSLFTPFQTIGKAASVVGSGDVVFTIREKVDR